MECKLTRFIIILGCLVLISSCASANGEKEEVRIKYLSGNSNRVKTVSGTYMVVDTNGLRVQDAFKILQEDLKVDGIVIEEPYKAWQQVVSGYKIRIECFYTQNKVEGVIIGIIFFPPEGDAEVIGIKTLN